MIFQKFYIAVLCLWLSIQLILGSVGLPIIEHYCGVSGEKSTSILEEKECCCEISASNLAKLSEVNQNSSSENHCSTSSLEKREKAKEDCCDTQTSYEKGNFEAISSQKTVFDFDHFVAIIPSQISFKKFTEKTFFTSFQITHFADLPPPNWKIGRLFIVFIQVFRL